jgi:hypothetical protein
MKIFKKDRQIADELKNEHEKLEARIAELENIELVECDKCGCLLKKKTAIKGDPEIRQKEEMDWKYCFIRAWGRSIGKDDPAIPLVDYIYYPYYCKIHKPKKVGAK